jgi:ATP synthase F1 gamma subunit
MLDGGADPRYLSRRLIRMATEDIGLADPRALRLTLDAAETYERLGSPEGELALAEATVYLACAAKSNAVYNAYNQVRAFVAKDQSRPVPEHLRNAPTKLMKQLGYGKLYRYAHDEPEAYAAGEIDRLDVAYTRFQGIAKQEAVAEMLLPLAPPQAAAATAKLASDEYDFEPSAESILEELLPASFMARLFKCFLDAAVSEQVARMVAMKAATENAGGLIKNLSRQYNRARQSQITGEIMEILGGVEALKQ